MIRFYRTVFDRVCKREETKERFLPENVIQQEGPNKGAIKDEELARIGAEAEDEFRDAKIKEWVWQKIINPLSLNSKNYSKEIRADAAGTKAIMQEMYTKAKEAGIPEKEITQAIKEILKELHKTND